MVQKKGRKKLFTAIAVLAALLLIIGGVALAKSLSSNNSADPNSTAKKDSPAISDQANSTDKPTSDVPKATDQPAVDPAKVNTVDIEPMSLTVSYMKGIGGFDFQVLKTPNGTKYVQFSSSKLVGTKCTNDEGDFASILESPTADESSTLAKTTVVDGTTYGLSLADGSCTSNPDLLKQYQDAFSEPFSLLKKM
jgi:hypothetical protein